MVFEYAPQDDALCESFWTFAIPSQNISVPFLLVGIVSEPRVAFDRPSMAFGAVQIGVRGKSRFSIVNDEAAPFAFALDKASYDATPELLAAAGGGPPVLELTPDGGMVPPRGKVRLRQVSFAIFSDCAPVHRTCSALTRVILTVCGLSPRSWSWWPPLRLTVTERSTSMSAAAFVAKPSRCQSTSR